MFGQRQSHISDEHASIEYVGVFKDILKLDYGPISTPIIFMWCAWVWNGSDVRGNPTYKWDEVGFLLAKFWYMIAEGEDPLFFMPSPTSNLLGWRTKLILEGGVIHKERWSTHITMDSSFNWSGIDDGVPWLNIAMTHPPMPQDANLVGAKELSTKELAHINEAFSHLV